MELHHHGLSRENSPRTRSSSTSPRTAGASIAAPTDMIVRVIGATTLTIVTLATTTLVTTTTTTNTTTSVSAKDLNILDVVGDLLSPASCSMFARRRDRFSGHGSFDYIYPKMILGLQEHAFGGRDRGYFPLRFRCSGSQYDMGGPRAFGFGGPHVVTVGVEV
ncbi:uncharacterized protein B0H18DRAFT_1118356 [Fomitopsis serialis]|uniref:uncharacterized protein n=1 Tax=Fomitopsis serialis TaxID=139415 RepID=UPI002007CAE0|nr:uncharacterized protein B0H18DRAFT_1118356 [Neoantrodia serialis]KAH9927840.1 hypothetical protein B0H18DRAFT_1118356 [Neoantrodia serialis]